MWTRGVALAAFGMAFGCKSPPKDTEASWQVMGTTLRVHAWGPDSIVRQRAVQAAHDEVVLIDNLMSTYQDNSEISTVNRRAGTDSITYVSPSLTSVLATALNYGRKTDGAFDVTVGPLVSTWGFHERDRKSVV